MVVISPIFRSSRMRVVAVALTAIFLLTGCSSSQGLNSIQVGMTKQDVIQVLGSPSSVRAQSGTEVLIYNLYGGITANPWYQDYYVQLAQGRVVAYGK